MKKPEYDQTPTQADIELAWKIKRSSRITASGIAKLMTGGRGKSEEFGKTAMDYIDDIIFQIRENDLVGETDVWQMQFGKDHEEDAIHWLRENFMEEIKHGSTDFGSVLFMEVGDYFGSSPDAIAYSNDEPIAWVECKCPANKKKACNLTLPSVRKEDVIDELPAKNWLRKSTQQRKKLNGCTSSSNFALQGYRKLKILMRGGG